MRSVCDKGKMIQLAALLDSPSQGKDVRSSIFCGQIIPPRKNRKRAWLLRLRIFDNFPDCEVAILINLLLMVPKVAAVVVVAAAAVVVVMGN